MSLAALIASTPRGRAGLATVSARYGWLVPALAAVAVAIALRAVLPTNEDVSWLIELAGRTLSGARPYVDYFEVNPPAAIGLYLAPTMLARMLALRPETVTDVMIFAAAALSLALSAGTLNRAGLLPAAAGKVLLTAAILALLILPGYAFAEREHIAVLAALPALALLTARLAGQRPRGRDIAIAGLGHALVVIIKPMLVLGLLGPVAVLIVMAGWRTVLTAAELWLGAALAVLYGAAVVLLMPAFVQTMLPLATTIYVPRRLPWPVLLALVAQSGWPCGPPALLLLARSRRVGPAAVILASASAGFAGAFLLQGKGFAYHLYPALACGVLALACALAPLSAVQADAPHDPGPSAAVAAMTLGLCAALGFAETLTRIDPFALAPGVASAIATLGPQPRLLVLSPIFGLGQPFVRRLGGRWAGSAPALWISGDVEALTGGETPTPAQAEAVRFEQALYARDIVRNTPDAILVDGPHWQAWIDRSPVLTAAMADYRPVAPPFGQVTLWRRVAGTPLATP